jgi:propionyl-CoA synthetase
MLSEYACKGAIINDNWGLSEQGVPLSCTSLIPDASLNSVSTVYIPGAHKPVIPGCAGTGMPGMNIHCVDDSGNDVPPGTMGNMVLGLPLSPSSFRTLWGDLERFYTSYLKRFGGKWFDTGDAGMLTQEGYVKIMSRSDDVINVAGHRLSTGKESLLGALLSDQKLTVILRSHRASNISSPSCRRMLRDWEAGRAERPSSAGFHCDFFSAG